MNRNRRNQNRANLGVDWRLRPAYIRAQLAKVVHVLIHGGIIATDDWTAMISDGQVVSFTLTPPARLFADVQRGTQDPEPGGPVNRNRRRAKFGPRWAVEPEVRATLAKLRALCSDPADVSARIRQAAIFEAMGGTADHVLIWTKVLSCGRLTGEDLVRMSQRGIDTRPALDYVHRHYRPTEDQ